MEPAEGRYMDSLKVNCLTGPELKARRRAMGINQTEMGRRVGISRHAVSYWERKLGPLRPNPYGDTLARIFKVLRIKILPIKDSSTRARGDGVLELSPEMQRHVDRQLAALLARIEAKASKRRVRCGAKTRPGHPCRNLSEPGKRRCKFHGGKSTGPKTPEGRKRISEAMKARHKAKRESYRTP